MYQVLIDGRDLYYPGDGEYTISEAVLRLMLNDSGTFECCVPVINPEYGNIKNRRSGIQVSKNGSVIFSGEVRESEKDFYGSKRLYAVGELSYLFDSIQPQAKYQDASPRELLETWLDIHNSQVEERKKFYVGIVTVHDSNDSLYRFANQETTLDCIREKLCEKLGGYLRIRSIGAKRYLDLVTLEDYGKICEQPIEFGDNLLDYTETLSASELYTACIPRGAKLDESPIEGLEAYVDIKPVNGGLDYVHSEEAVAMYGWNRTVVSWDDVMEPENLKKKAENWLKDAQYETMVLNLSAADLSLLDADMEKFELGDFIPVYSKPHGMDRTFPVQSLEINLQDPAADKLQLGTTMKLDYTDQNKGHYQEIKQDLENVRQTTAWLQSAIDNVTGMMTGSKGGYKVTEFDEDGKWLRDLYMNAPSKEQATRVMQINMNGIGFSRSGFEGPYKNAWTIDGVLLGEFIKAGSVQAEALSVEYKAEVTDEIVKTSTAKLKVAEGLISAEVTRATKQEGKLSASIKVNADTIKTKVTSGQVTSLIEQKADSIRLKADRISWRSTYSSMTEAGMLTCENARISGVFQCGDWYNVKMEDGKIKGGRGDEVYGYIDYSASSVTVGTGEIHNGIQIQGGGLRISVDCLSTRQTSDTGATTYAGSTGSKRVITDIWDNEDGSVSWRYSNIHFENGLMVSAL